MKLLETARLLIRIDTLEEYTEVFKTHTDEALKEIFGFLNEEEILVQKDKLKGGIKTYRSTCVFFHLILKENQKVIGAASLHNWYPMHRRAEIGYNLKFDEYKGKGLMREAAKAVVEYGFAELNLNRIEAIIAPDNVPSKRTVERLGFVQEGLLKEHYNDNGIIGDSLVYGLLKSNYSDLIV